MKADDILVALGEVDATLVKSAKKSRRSNKRIIIALSSMPLVL